MKYSVSCAIRKYNRSRSHIYFWKIRWDGTLESMVCQSRRRPHSYPNQHAEAELKLIWDIRRRNPNLEWWSYGTGYQLQMDTFQLPGKIHNIFGPDV
ncbi:MAG: hypothetical protein ACLU62_10130 [Hydrogeniiclostridium sp.]